MLNKARQNNLMTKLLMLSLFFVLFVASNGFAETILFQDDFGSGNADRWQLQEGWQVVSDNGNFVLSSSQHSFEWAGILFRAMANIRNFAPFMSGTKNAHKSTFMLAQGQTYNLPRIQVMNVHNAFLFG
jgi:hypothetical protein